jgi:hypothetical protein
MQYPSKLQESLRTGRAFPILRGTVDFLDDLALVSIFTLTLPSFS